MIVGISLFLGCLFDFLIYGKFPGLAFPVYVALIIMGLLGITWLYGRTTTSSVLWLLVPVFFFAAMVSVRASFLLTALNLIAVFLLLLLIAQVAFSEPLQTYRIKDYFRLALVPFMYIVSLFKTLGDLVTLRGVKADKRTMAQVATGIVITIPLLVVFSLLFASADLVFQRALSQIVSFSIGPEFVFRTILIFFAMLGFTGAYSFVFRKSEPGVGFPGAVPIAKKTGGFGRIEGSILLGSVNALFGAFILVQITYLFGGLGNISGQGFTYAQYARRGFFELVAVAVITLAMLLLIERFTPKNMTGHSGLFRSLSTLLVVQVMVIMASSLTRMSFYENAYGFTELRLYVHVFIFFIAAVYVALLYKIHIDNREDTFTFKVFLLVVAFLAFMNAVNPDAYIARQNMQRFRQTGKIDAGYLGGLSDDALPVTISLLKSKDASVREEYASRLRDRVRVERGPLFSRWQSLNLSRVRAKELMQESDQEMKNLLR